MSTNPNYVAKSPYCEHDLDPATAVGGKVACACGKSSDARWVRELGWLQARTKFVSDRIIAGDEWYDTSATADHAVKPVAANRTQFGEQLLYILGGLSIFVAVGVFAAVSWKTLGAYGQAGLLFVLAAAAAAAAFWTRMRIAGFAGTMAILSTVILGVLALSAPSTGLIDDSYLEWDSWYPATVILILAVLSALLGMKSRIAGWLILFPIGVLIATTVFIQVVTPAYVDLEGLDYANPVFYTVVVMLLNRYQALLDRQQLSSLLTQLTTFIGQGFLAFFSFTNVIAISSERRPWLIGLSLILTAAMYGHLGYRWRISKSLNLDSVVSVYAAPLIAALGLSYLFTAQTFTSLRYADEIALLAGGIFAAVLYLYPVYAELQKPAVLSLNLAAGGLWFFHFARLSADTNGFDTTIAGLTVSLYFAIITAAAFAQWNRTRFVLSYVLGLVSGVIAIMVAISTTDLGENGPEAFTLPAALWLAVMLWVLRRGSFVEMNSGIWLGIPLAMALIPSAAIAVSNYGQSNFDAARFWAVLLLGLVLTLVGTMQRVTGLLIPGAISYVLVVFPQLATDLGLVIPRWVLFAVFGGVLISVAARYERLQQLRVETGSWRKVFR